MKTAISIPDEVFEEAEQTAKRLGLSRSELFTRAMKAFLKARSGKAVTESYNVAFGAGTEDDLAAFERQANRRTLLDVEWED